MDSAGGGVSLPPWKSQRMLSRSTVLPLKIIIPSSRAAMLLVNQGRETQALLRESEVVESIFLPRRLRPGSGPDTGPSGQDMVSPPASSFRLETFRRVQLSLPAQTGTSADPNCAGHVSHSLPPPTPPGSFPGGCLQKEGGLRKPAPLCGKPRWWLGVLILRSRCPDSNPSFSSH